MDEENPRIIELRVSNHRAYVWNVDDLALLRSKHRVCGVLSGTLPHVSQQNVFLGLPLMLIPEEVVLLVEKQLAVLVDDPSAHRKPSRGALENWNTERKASVKTQLAAETRGAKEDLATSRSRSMSEDAVRKRKAREEKRAAAALAKHLAEGDIEGSSELPTPEMASLSQPPSTPQPELTSLSQATYIATVPGWGFAVASHMVQHAARAGIWSYPANAHERAKCNVFRDLWEKGHFMGGGIKFGGDFLVYPGDPLRYHSHFVASVIDSRSAPIAPMEIVAHGRLGTATKKAHLLCTWDEEKQEVSYYSVEWAGFG
ncbi:tRNA-splicing endonuclease subunit [Steccherinum ochraceum]|uniref:tRNA-splicing endonuclease subunit Sen34 n=1 Tax=Steccherinum ochraceum TaxID=92696 RepID=A0A4R0RT00_9APHY|nr:tRNA-splicing endonuclease subunit [Steccherinum ochraceum]